MRRLLLCLVLLTSLGVAPMNVEREVQTWSSTHIAAPVLKWQRGGCTSWCMTGWYASPAVADLNGDGWPEVIWASYNIWALDGRTGNVIWNVATGHDRSEPNADNVGRTWPGIVVADLGGNGDLEIVTAHSGGYLSVYNHDGYFYPGWPQRPAPSSELRTLAVYDLDGDGDLEILTASTSDGTDEEWFVYEHDGTLRPGWPQLTSGCCAAGCYNENLAVGDIDGDGQAEIIAPSDVHYTCAFEADGSRIQANPMFGDKNWCEVGIWVDLAAEQRGWGYCGTEHRPNFADSAPAISDVNGDGTADIVIVGNVYDCSTDPYTSLYHMIFLREPDLTRFNQGGHDWTVLPMPDPAGSGAPLSEDYNVIETAEPNAVVADLDGDGQQEMLFASYDGRVHAYWLDKTEHGNWPYSVYHQAEGFIRFASEPVVADLDNDGQAEVIFGSWTQKQSRAAGKLHILDSSGNPLYEVELPISEDWDGSLGAPTLADIDGDPDLEIVMGTAHSGVIAYDLPGTANARILWGTGRGNFQRSGSPLRGSLSTSVKTVDRTVAAPGDPLAYLVRLSNPAGPTLVGARVTDTLPAGVVYANDLWASAGSYAYAGGVITWTGSVQAGIPVTITFGATIHQPLPDPIALINEAIIDEGDGRTFMRQAVTIVNGRTIYLPVIMHLP